MHVEVANVIEARGGATGNMAWINEAWKGATADCPLSIAGFPTPEDSITCQETYGSQSHEEREGPARRPTERGSCSSAAHSGTLHEYPAE